MFLLDAPVQSFRGSGLRHLLSGKKKPSLRANKLASRKPASQQTLLTERLPLYI